MKTLQLFVILVIPFLFFGCTPKELPAPVYTEVQASLNYLTDVKPILDRRCAVCHSCYNAPCQLKLSSYEGVRRGATKIDMYGRRLQAIEPTRLFIDARSEEAWRQRGFYSITDVLKETPQTSIMGHVLNQKLHYPENVGSYDPENDELSCSENAEELREYFDDNPHRGMPYGMPALTRAEHDTLSTWLARGALGKDMQPKITPQLSQEIAEWETYLNGTTIKEQVVSRYLYEHLYLAHIRFEGHDGEFFQLVRSRTASGEAVDEIPTRLAYHDPGSEPFYYRFVPITSTLVHKTHMVYTLSPAKMKRYTELFYSVPWTQPPHLISYETEIAANAIEAFEQIPAESRYRFMLDDVRYFIMTFIRGPVCRGQVALNVINDQFWVFFLDPEYDMAIQNPEYLKANYANLVIPNMNGHDSPWWNTLGVIHYAKDSIAYYQNRNKVYAASYPNGLPMEAIWKGNGKTPVNDGVLTIYRHFDSASVVEGALGNLPKTMWVIDYPLLERIYYSLVVGYDVFGNLTQGLFLRKFMDRLRVEGESNFLEFLPKTIRRPLFESWYIGWLAQELTTYTPSETPTGIVYKTLEPQREFATYALERTGNAFDPINYVACSKLADVSIPKHFENRKDLEQAMRAVTIQNTITTQLSDNGANVAFIRFNLKGESYVYTLVVNRWHDSVAFIFNEDLRLDPHKDTINFIPGYLGSYPNYFFEVSDDAIPDFFEMLRHFDVKDPSHLERFRTYGVNRADADFWEHYDRFQKHFDATGGEEAGLFDLNRYFRKTLIEVPRP